MSFKRHMVEEVLFALFVLSLLPLWLPVWIVYAVRDWYWECRYTWESMERDRLRQEASEAPKEPT